MCEPFHSTVQWSVTDGQESLIRAQVEQPSSLVERGVKIAGFLHYAVPGGGHSEAIRKLSLTGSRSILDNRNDFETEWWIRKVRHDVFRGKPYDKELALECAEAYAKRTVIGNLQQFRRWFENSLNHTDHVRMYIERALEDMFTTEARDLVLKKLRYALGNNHASFLNLYWFDNKELATKLLLGAMRNRKLLVPEWADDNSIWKV